MARLVQLPELRGKYLTAFRGMWLILLLLAMPTFVYFPFDAERSQQARSANWFAAGLRGAGGDANVVRVGPFGEEAIAKGVTPGETLLAIDGKPISAVGGAAIDALLRGPDGTPVRLTMVKDGEAARTITVLRDHANVTRAYAGSGLNFPLRRWLAFWFFYVTNVVWLASAILLFVRRPQDPVAALLSLSTLIFLDGVSALWPATPWIVAPTFEGFGRAFLLTAMLVFPGRSFTPRWTLLGLPAIAGVMILTIAGYWSEAVGTAGSICYYLVAAGIIGLVIRRYRAMASDTARQQIKFALFGAVAAITFAVIGFLLVRWGIGIPAIGVAAWVLLTGQLCAGLANLSLASGLLVSLLRYRLYDADAVISRSAAYAFLTLLVGATFAGSEKVIEVLGEEFFGESMRAVSAGMGAAVAATLIAPLHNRVHRWTEHRFQKSLAALRNDLPKLVGDMREFASLDHLLATVVTRIERGVRASRAAVLLRDDTGFDLVRAQDIDEGAVAEWRRGWQPRAGAALDCDRDDALFPIRLPLHADGAGVIGWILLGPRPDGSFYGKDEREALAEVADPVARAIHIVRQRDAREAERDARQVALEQRLAMLEARSGVRTAVAH